MRLNKVLAAVAVGSVAFSVWAASGTEGTPGSGLRGGPGMHQGMGPGAGGDHERGGRGPMSPERAAAMSERMVERLARTVDATPEQKAKLSQIAKAAAGDLASLRKEGGDLRKQSLDLLKAPAVDRAAIESLRSRQMAIMDALSKRTTAAMADAAEVLTPEQRAKLAARWESRRGGRDGRDGHRHGHHHGHRG